MSCQGSASVSIITDCVIPIKQKSMFICSIMGGGGGRGAGGTIKVDEALNINLGAGGGGGGGSGYFKTVTGHADANSEISITIGKGGERGKAETTSGSATAATAGTPTTIWWVENGTLSTVKVEGGQPGENGEDPVVGSTLQNSSAGAGGNGGDGGYGGGGGGGSIILQPITGPSLEVTDDPLAASPGTGGKGQEKATSGTAGGIGITVGGYGGGGPGEGGGNNIVSLSSDWQAGYISGAGGVGGGPEGGRNGGYDIVLSGFSARRNGHPASDHSGGGGGGGTGGDILSETRQFGTDGGNGAGGYCIINLFPILTEHKNNSKKYYKNKSIKSIKSIFSSCLSV